MFSVLFARCSPEGDAPEAQPFCRGCGPVEGWPGAGECRPDRCLIHLSETDLQEDGHHAPDHPAQEGVGPDVDRHQPAFPSDPDRMHGPDRRSVRRPEGAEVVPADEDRSARDIAAVSSGARNPSAVRSRNGLRGPFQTV